MVNDVSALPLASAGMSKLWIHSKTIF